jgi:uncharacterized alpha-E superfamily protein
MVRYVERADNLARLIDVNRQLLLDFEKLDTERLRGFWQPIILSTGDEEAFAKLYDDTGSEEVIRFLTDDPRNPNSIRSCIALARENARTVRDQVSDELWEELNALYLFSRSDEASRLIDSDPPRYYENIRRAAVTFLGIASSTTSRNEAWDFMDLGRHLERADKTTRFLDVASYLPTAGGEATPGVMHGSAILRSCGAMGAFRAAQQEISARSVTDFLIFNKDFPRSVRYCIERVDISLHQISRAPRGTFSNEAERESGRLLAELNFGSTDDIFKVGLHEYLDALQGRFNTIGGEIFETYMLMPQRALASPGPKAPTLSDVADWQMEQQQQQQQQ